MVNRTKERHTRSLPSKLEVRSEEEDFKIEGYFAVFNRDTELCPGAYESIAREAFDGTLSNDVRALINHDTSLVLGRNKSGTLQLKADDYGLWGSVRINPRDTDAMNLYERVKRGDVDQCSFGFNIIKEDIEFREDDSIKWTLREVDLHEVSVCTFPAYQDTGVQARHDEAEQHKQRKKQAWKENMRERLKNGTKTNNA